MPGIRKGAMPSPGESIKSGNRMSALEAEEMKAMKARKPRGGMPSPGESVKSGNRISAQEAAEMKAMRMKKGGAVDKGGSVDKGIGDIKMRKYAMGGMVEKPVVMVTPRRVAVPMLKKGGPVKSSSCKRGSDNMAMMAKALKGKK